MANRNVKISNLDDIDEITKNDLFVLVSCSDNGIKRTVKSTLNNITDFLINNKNSLIYKKINYIDTNLSNNKNDVNELSVFLKNKIPSLTNSISNLTTRVEGLEDGHVVIPSDPELPGTDSGNTPDPTPTPDAPIDENTFTNLFNKHISSYENIINQNAANIKSINTAINTYETYKAINTNKMTSESIKLEQFDIKNANIEAFKNGLTYAYTLTTDSYVTIINLNKILLTGYDLKYSIHLGEEVETNYGKHMLIEGVNYDRFCYEDDHSRADIIACLPLKQNEKIYITISGTLKDDYDFNNSDLPNREMFIINYFPFKAADMLSPSAISSLTSSYNDLKLSCNTLDLSAKAINKDILTNKNNIKAISSSYDIILSSMIYFLDNITTTDMPDVLTAFNERFKSST